MLTARQERFIEAYLVCCNGTQAAIGAGYSSKTARAIACENLRKPQIKAELARRQKKLRGEFDGLAVRVCAE